MTEFVDPVDLTNCDREPIHILGAVQPIGVLVAISQDWVVTRASANLSAFLDIETEAAIGRPLADLFDGEAIHSLRNRVALLRGADAVERAFGVRLTAGRAPFDVAVHISGDEIVIEAEPSSDEAGDTTNTVRSMMARLDQTPTFERFYNEGVRLVRAISGYDRVMIYRFDQDDSGEVVAEACRPGIGSFKGLHYPATDIPKQARELYKRNLLRIITDIGATPVPIVPQKDAQGRPLDLSLSILRSVSPIHIEYLKNMGVGASMSISIIVDDKLWGLFACHHYGPKAPSFERRSLFELFARCSP